MNIKDLRRTVLQLHYNLSKGNSWELVMRIEIGKELGVDFNNKELLGVIKYLEDKGFLKCQTNVEDSITDVGIDEVENGFPILGDSNDNKKESVFIKVIENINETLELGKKGLLKLDELQEIRKKAEEILENNIERDTELWRKFDKHRRQTVWFPVTHDGYAPPNTVGVLIPLKGFMEDALELQGISAGRKQVFIKKGEIFTARQIVRKILEKAKSSIDIQDNYIDVEILSILEPYIQGNSVIQVRILTQNIGRAFKSDLILFNQQYSTNIEVKTHQNCHDRFIIINGQEVYHSGHSFKDLGKKASAVGRLEEPNEIKKLIDDFNLWWSTGISIL